MLSKVPCGLPGRTVAVVLRLAQWSVFLLLAVAVILGMLIEPADPETAPPPPQPRRVELREDEVVTHLFLRPRPKPPHNLINLLLHDEAGKPVFKTGCNLQGDGIYFSGTRGGLHMSLMTLADGRVAVCVQRGAQRTQIDFWQNGSSSLLVTRPGPVGVGKVLGQVWVSAEGRPSVAPASR